jgi:hypothetical protein
MVKLTITLDETLYSKVGDKLPEIKKRGLKLSGQEMLRNLGLNSPVDEGLLRQWFFYKTTTDEIEIRTPAPYAPLVNDGTGVYAGKGVIRPKKGKALAFTPGKKWNGPVGKDGKVFLKYSKGQKGQHFVEKSIKQTSANLEQIWIKTITDVVG